MFLKKTIPPILEKFKSNFSDPIRSDPFKLILILTVGNYIIAVFPMDSNFTVKSNYGEYAIKDIKLELSKEGQWIESTNYKSGYLKLTIEDFPENWIDGLDVDDGISFKRPKDMKVIH